MALFSSIYLSYFLRSSNSCFNNSKVGSTSCLILFLNSSLILFSYSSNLLLIFPSYIISISTSFWLSFLLIFFVRLISSYYGECLVKYYPTFLFSAIRLKYSFCEEVFYYCDLLIGFLLKVYRFISSLYVILLGY